MQDSRRKETTEMTKYMTGTHPRRSDELARRRQELAWVRIDSRLMRGEPR
jgi:hypothetical protein